MNELLARILDAHGGMDRWRAFQKVEATIVTGGGLFARACCRTQTRAA
jgi:hypothetical protein